MNDRQSDIRSTVEKYRNKLYGFIRGRVRSTEEAEDILQDVWYQLSRILDLNEIENLSGWLFRVARNRITDRFRKKDRLFLSNAEDEGIQEMLGLLTNDPESPEEYYFREVFWEELQQALEELPEKQRHTFIWNELEDQTLQEIADRTGEKLKTVISRKRYAVQHLRRRLQEIYEEMNN